MDEITKYLSLTQGKQFQNKQFRNKQTNKKLNKSIFKLKEGFVTEKNKASSSIKLFSELMTGVLDSNKKDIADKDTEAVFLQNKKIIKELINSLSQLMRNYQVNEKEFKLLLLGKVLQSLQDGK
jgi:hypothetical protein